MGPKISSTFPIWVLFCKKIGALKYGIFSLISFVTASPSLAWRKDETSTEHKTHQSTNQQNSLLDLVLSKVVTVYSLTNYHAVHLQINLNISFQSSKLKSKPFFAETNKKSYTEKQNKFSKEGREWKGTHLLLQKEGLHHDTHHHQNHAHHGHL